MSAVVQISQSIIPPKELSVLGSLPFPILVLEQENKKSKSTEWEWIRPAIFYIILCRHYDYLSTENPEMLDARDTAVEMLEKYATTEIPEKYKWTLNFINEAKTLNKKVLVWSSFVGNILSLKKLLKKFNPAVIYGSISEKNRNINDKPQQDDDIVGEETKVKNNDFTELKNKTIGQMKSIAQEKQLDQDSQNEKKNKELSINSFKELLEICNLKKEVKLKYELEKNVNLVSFENQRMEISFNDELDKDFIKILSSKLYDWTSKRWIITLSKEKGDLSIKQKEIDINIH